MTRIVPYLLAGLLLLLGSANVAHAANCSAYPYTLTNGQTADANQVMADFNNILSCGNNNLLGKNNNLSDVQSPATSRTNLGLGTAAVENLANATARAVTDDGAGNLILNSYPTIHSQVFTGTGVFTVPATASTATVFKFTIIGGGGAGGGTLGGGNGNGAASGGALVAQFTGFTPSASVTITIGSGAAGSTGAGSSGSASTVVYSAVTIATAGGGAGGEDNGFCSNSIPPGASSATSGGGASLVSVWGGGAQPGSCGSTVRSQGGPGAGGGNSVGSGGAPGFGTGSVGGNGTMGGGGGGAMSGGGALKGGNGGNGVAIVEWVL